MYFRCLIHKKRYRLFKILNYLNILNIGKYILDIIVQNDSNLFQWTLKNNRFSNIELRRFMIFASESGSYEIVKYLFILNKTKSFIKYYVINDCISFTIKNDDVVIFKIIHYNFIINYRFSNILDIIQRCIKLDSLKLVKFSLSSKNLQTSACFIFLSILKSELIIHILTFEI